jgi:hypothetical protein
MQTQLRLLACSVGDCPHEACGGLSPTQARGGDFLLWDGPHLPLWCHGLLVVLFWRACASGWCSAGLV